METVIQNEHQSGNLSPLLLVITTCLPLYLDRFPLPIVSSSLPLLPVLPLSSAFKEGELLMEGKERINSDAVRYFAVMFSAKYKSFIYRPIRVNGYDQGSEEDGRLKRPRGGNTETTHHVLSCDLVRSY